MNAATLSLVIRFPLVLLTVVALWYSALLGRAAYLAQGSSLSSFRAAVRLIPYNSDLIMSLDAAGLKPSPDLLGRAVELNPFQVNAWIRLGLNAEINQRDAALAEKFYVQTRKVDHMYLPLWTLANFYARQRSTTKFFQTAKAALALTPYDSRPILYQARALAESPDRVFAILPDRQRVLFEYLSLLLGENDDAQLEQTALRATQHIIDRSNNPPGLPDWWLSLLGSTEDRLLQAGRAKEATRIWQSMQRRNWTASPAPTIDSPLSNGSFRYPVFEHGFDWAVPVVKGVLHEQYPALGKMALTFDGTQPESCRLLRQFIPVEAGRTYRLAWEVESQDLNGTSGLKWRIYAPAPERDAARTEFSSPDLMAGNQQKGFWEFVAPSGWTAALLTLEYDRPLGEVRAEGSVDLRNISMSSVFPATSTTRRPLR